MKRMQGAVFSPVDLNAVSRKIWVFRDLYSKEWPTPDRSESLDFMLTEVGEAVDARIRRKDKFVRNNPGVLGLYDEALEWGDVLMMLVTAHGDNKFPELYVDQGSLERRNVVSKCLDAYASGETYAIRVASARVFALIESFGVSPIDIIEAKLRKIAEKIARNRGIAADKLTSGDL